MHTCFGRKFVRIMETGQIQAGPVDAVIGKAASFFFYGKPSYRPKNDGRSSDTISSALFTFVLDYDRIPCPSSMLPFDSGGYDRFYKDICDEAELHEYYLPKAKDAPAQLVGGFFGGNRAYYDMSIREDLADAISRLDFHSDSIRRIWSPHNRTTYDQRAGSIEMHFVDPLVLTPDNLLAIIGPGTALEDDEVIAFASSLSADLLPYDLDLDNVDGRQRQVREVAKRWLDDERYFA